MALRIIVDRLRCIGSGNCVDAAPEVFQLDETDVSIIVSPVGAPPDNVVTAAENCPVDAIRIIDEQAGQQLYP